MREPRIIPTTPIWTRYLKLRGEPQQRRLEEARRLIDHPDELAADFAASVAAFEEYANVEEHFYPTERTLHDVRPALDRTIDVARRLEKQRHLVPVDAAHRRSVLDAELPVTPVAASLLAADYVDRELLVQRTTSPAEWSNGRPNRGGLRLDVLLADAVDRTPIVAELKLPGDMDPFFALVQALACAAHLVTMNQYQRMRAHLVGGQFPELSARPRVDVWVLFVDALDRTPGAPPKGRYMGQLEAAVEALAPRLLSRDGIRASVRRMAGLGLKLDADNTLRSEVRWAWAG